MRGKAFWSLVVGLAAIAGCGNPTGSIQEPRPPQIPISELRSAPETMVLRGLPVSMELYLSRDFMPTVPPAPEGGPLGAGVQLRVPGRADFPSMVTEAYLWVINGEQVWSKVMLRMNYGSSPLDQVDLVSGGGGPRWGPGLLVDVAVGVRDAHGELSLAIVRNVLIRRTE